MSSQPYDRASKTRLEGNRLNRDTELIYTAMELCQWFSTPLIDPAELYRITFYPGRNIKIIYSAHF